jgi:hypothetical protein
MLTVTVPDNNHFYSLYADGLFSRKSYDRESGVTRLFFDPGAVVFLFYTYPAHREACVIRNAAGPALLPGLSKRVSLLFSVHASRVDKLRRAAGFLNAREGGAYSRDDGFYIRLAFIVSRKGKLSYYALRRLAGDTAEAAGRHS